MQQCPSYLPMVYWPLLVLSTAAVVGVIGYFSGYEARRKHERKW